MEGKVEFAIRRWSGVDDLSRVFPRPSRAYVSSQGLRANSITFGMQWLLKPGGLDENKSAAARRLARNPPEAGPPIIRQSAPAEKTTCPQASRA